jgi:hypothetical protein
LGLHAGLGLEFIINEAVLSVKKGDVVLLSIEYPLYKDEEDGDPDLINYTQNIYPKAKDYYRIRLKDNLIIWFQHLKNRFQKQHSYLDSVYNRKSFNTYGDMIG